MKNLKAFITSPPDREKIVFEIWLGNQQLAEISNESGEQLEIEIYAAPDGNAWHLNLQEFQIILEKGIQNLQNISSQG